MKIAAIDIGSNAIRLLVEEIFMDGEQYHIEKVSFTRVPIRLGEDVFENGLISPYKSDQLIKTMKAFSYLMDVHGVKTYRACATSAMREAQNSRKIIRKIKEKTNLKIEVISGEEEADLIFSNFKAQPLDKHKNFVYIDVGGGSTELTLIKNGQRVESHSFDIGTVRMLKGKMSKKKWVEARTWIHHLFQDESNLLAIGTGGNINKIFKEAGKKPSERISRKEIESVYDYLKGFSYIERITKLQIKPDRADVIIPAAEIYTNMMDFAGAKEMIVPKVGLSDGIVLDLFEKWKAKTK